MRYNIKYIIYIFFAFLSINIALAKDHKDAFKKPDYSYLPTLNLNVSKVSIINQAQPNHGSLEEKVPVMSSDQSLALMAQQRVHANGLYGECVIYIKQASIERDPKKSNVLIGLYDIELMLKNMETKHYSDIVVTVHNQLKTKDKATKPHNLYMFNQMMMRDMNIELEYQIRKNLALWLNNAVGASVNQEIKTEKLPD